MADDIYGLLGATDLQGFNQAVQAQDPYGIAGRSLQSWQPDTSTWSPGATAATAFGKSFLSAFLGNYARQNAADQTNAVINVLPQLAANPGAVAAPEGVDENLFSSIKGAAVLRDYQRRAVQQANAGSGMSDLMKSIFTKGIKTDSIDPAAAMQAVTTGNYEPILNGVGKRPELIVADTVSVDNPLANGKESTAQKTQAYFQQFKQAGMPDVQAATAAKEQVKGEIAANNKSFDDAKEARQYGQNLLSVANTARAGIGQAGQTGPFNPLAKAYEYVASGFGSKEAKQQISGDTLLNSVAPDIIKMARPIGGGATSDFESRAYLGSGPSTSNTPEANAQLVQKMENLGKLNIDYADFLEAYRDANAGSTVGAGKKWNEYKQAYPIFIGQGENMEINNNRPDWREYFAGVGSGSAPSSGANEQAAPIPTGQYTKSGKQVYILNGVKGTID